MRNKWVIEVISELAFVQAVTRFYGYGMDKGIILIADDDERASLIRAMLQAHMDAVELRFGREKQAQPCNYQIGVHMHSKLDNERKLLDFIEEQDFLPVIIVGGFVPELLNGKGYAFRCEADEQDFMDVEIRYKEFVKYVKENVSSIQKVVMKMSKRANFLSDCEKQNQKYERLAKNLATIGCIWNLMDTKNGISDEEGKRLEKFLSIVYSTIEAMERYDGEYDVKDAIRECFWKQVEDKNVCIAPVEKNGVSGEVENQILYDSDYYYVTDQVLRTVCKPILNMVSVVQLKREMALSGMLDCNDGAVQNYTKKKLVWNPYGRTERVRFIWIKKEYLMSDEGIALENV